METVLIFATAAIVLSMLSIFQNTYTRAILQKQIQQRTLEMSRLERKIEKVERGVRYIQDNQIKDLRNDHKELVRKFSNLDQNLYNINRHLKLKK